MMVHCVYIARVVISAFGLLNLDGEPWIDGSPSRPHAAATHVCFRDIANRHTVCLTPVVRPFPAALGA